MNRLQRLFVVLCSTAVIAASAQADVVNLTPSKDNTLYEDAGGALSNGAGEFIFSGRTGGVAPPKLRRAVLSFDIAGSIPAGAMISSASLTLNMSKTRPGTRTMTLHRLTADWGEGTSNAGSPGGAGAASTRF